MTFQSVTDEQLLAAGLRDVARARRLIASLAGQGVTDDLVEELAPLLLPGLAASPDPERALLNFCRWTEAVAGRYTHVQYLLRHPAALDIFFSICGTSQLFSEILIRNPEYFEILANPGVRGLARTAGSFYADVSRFVDGIQRKELKLEAMRQFKHREILHIGARDILGLADMPATAREFSALADACIEKCYEIAVEDLARKHGEAVRGVAFAVIGMGKLGGSELNYSSDVDLMFVCGDEVRASGTGPSTSELSHRIAEAVVSGLSRDLQHGHLFRVDVRLRPEGRFGALVRTLASYRAYYESWAEPWEMQALLKARVVAGDPGLGEGFMTMIQPFVYRRIVSDAFVADVRRNKERVEQKAQIENQWLTNVKVGFGAIRDIEFLVQLRLLELGGRRPELRSANTIEALERLAHGGVLDREASAELIDDYCFLRTVEHRLQLLYGLQTQTMPTEPRERELLAKRMGFADATAFDAEYRRRTGRVRRHFEREFRGAGRAAAASPPSEWREILANMESPAARSRAEAMLQERGFADPKRACALLSDAMLGTGYGRTQPGAQQQFLDIADPLLAACSRTGDPEAALAAVETLAQAMPSREQLYRSLLEGDELLERLCRLGAGSLPQVQTLSGHLEWLDLMVSDEIIDPRVKGSDECREELAARVAGARDDDRFWQAVATYVQRERLRIAARDLWGEIAPLAVTRELTAVSEAVLGAVLDRLVAKEAEAAVAPEARRALESIAIIGLGKLGSRELGYGSDLDLLVAYTGARGKPSQAGVQTPSFAAVTAAVARLLDSALELRVRGAPIEFDARLRPEGRFGVLCRTVAGYREYYQTTAESWERQVLTRARPVAGSVETGRAYMRVVHEAIYGESLSDAALEDIRHMKRRVESERLKPEQRETNLKLGYGGMSDIEFLVQMLQLRCGRLHPQVRVSSTHEALHALAACGALRGPDAGRLGEAYAHLTRLRNRLALQGTVATDVLPDDPRRLRALAIGLGVTDSVQRRAEQTLVARLAETMHDTRAIFEREFYGGSVR